MEWETRSPISLDLLSGQRWVLANGFGHWKLLDTVSSHALAEIYCCYKITLNETRKEKETLPGKKIYLEKAKRTIETFSWIYFRLIFGLPP